jgi:hypothetical protein
MISYAERRKIKNGGTRRGGGVVKDEATDRNRCGQLPVMTTEASCPRLRQRPNPSSAL